MTWIISSEGLGDDGQAFQIDADGKILQATVEADLWPMPNRFDVAEYLEAYQVEVLPAEIDILAIGYWYGMDKSDYEPACQDWRERHYVDFLMDLDAEFTRRTGMDTDELEISEDVLISWFTNRDQEEGSISECVSYWINKYDLIDNDDCFPMDRLKGLKK